MVLQQVVSLSLSLLQAVDPSGEGSAIMKWPSGLMSVNSASFYGLDSFICSCCTFCML